MTTARPTIYLTNFASRRPPQRGPGRVWTIMAKPRHWEHGDGAVLALTPDASDLDAVRAGAMHVDEYRRRFIAMAECEWIATTGPHRMKACARVGDGIWPVADGDTLCCACSREAAARGECHRAWAADLLVKAGWRVILDGVEMEARP